MTIRWNEDQRSRVSEALRRFPYTSDCCAAAARLVLPVGLEVDDGARGLQITGHWDNSANNSRNPDPAATVKWGDQSWDEMLSMAMGVIVNRDE